MKILVYGCGVIGSYLIHVLSAAGNDVTVVARGRRKKILEKYGLIIRHKLQKATTVDHPRVVASPPDGHFDIVFSVMQGQQQKDVLPALAELDAELVVLVGNNLDAARTQADFESMCRDTKSLLFGFQGTAGVRDGRRMICVHAGEGAMTVGGLHRETTVDERTLLRAAFSGTKYKLRWMDDMEGWLRCHAAFILPVVFVSYKSGCNLRRANAGIMDDMLKAAEEAYRFLASIGTKIRPVGDDEFFESSPKMAAAKAMLFVMGRTSLGELAATDHCRNAVTEMEWLDAGFAALRAQNPEYPMLHWDALRDAIPPWEELHAIYDKPYRETSSSTANDMLYGEPSSGTANGRRHREPSSSTANGRPLYAALKAGIRKRLAQPKADILEMRRRPVSITETLRRFTRSRRRTRHRLRKRAQNA